MADEKRRPLSCDAILVRPRLVDWEAYDHECRDGEPRYRAVRPAFEGHTDEQLREWIQDEGICDDELRLLDAVGDDNDAEVVREQLLELAWQTWDESERWPMMNFAYSLPQLDGVAAAAKAQSAVMGLPLIVMVDTVDDSVMLALTGGGMDFSWDICRAYIACGYRPPLHFCGLPRVAGESDLDVVDECQRSAEIAATWASNTADELMALRAEIAADREQREFEEDYIGRATQRYPKGDTSSA